MVIKGRYCPWIGHKAQGSVTTCQTPQQLLLFIHTQLNGSAVLAIGLVPIWSAEADSLAADRTLLLWLLLGLFPSVLRRLVMTNHAAGRGSKHAMMAGIMARHTPNSGTF
jgi:hypothetical protein